MNSNKKRDFEKVLQSLDNIHKIEAPAYFYTRLKARMENELIQDAKPVFLLRPLILTLSLLLVFVLNIITLTQNHKHTIPDNDQSATIESFASEYGLITKTIYQ